MPLEQFSVEDAPPQYFSRYFSLDDTYIMPKLLTARFSQEFRIAAMGDICANVDGLAECYADAKANTVDLVIVLGNVVGLGPAPRKTIEYLDLIATEKPLLVLQGTLDDAVLNMEQAAAWSLLSADQQESCIQQHAVLDEYSLQFLKSVQPYTGLILEVAATTEQQSYGFFHRPPVLHTSDTAVTKNHDKKTTAQFEHSTRTEDEQVEVLRSFHNTIADTSKTFTTCPGPYMKTICNTGNSLTVLRSKERGEACIPQRSTKPTCWPHGENCHFSYLLMSITEEKMLYRTQKILVPYQADLKLVEDLLQFYETAPNLAGHLIGDLLTREHWERDNNRLLADIIARNQMIEPKKLQTIIDAMNTRWSTSIREPSTQTPTNSGLIESTDSAALLP